MLYSSGDLSHNSSKNGKNMKRNLFKPFTWGVLGWNLLVILWGAYVRASGSGAGCGQHWPLCNGEVIPQAPNMQMQIEFTHRLLSGGALLLIATMVIWGYRVTAKGSPVRKGLTAAGTLIVTEALLGAGLVLFELVEENSTAFRAIAVALHLANTFLLIGSLALTAYWASGGSAIQVKGQGLKVWLLGAGLLGMLVIGMSGAITALGDTLFPVKSLAEGFVADLDPNAHFLVRLRVYHPVIAVIDCCLFPVPGPHAARPKPRTGAQISGSAGRCRRTAIEHWLDQSCYCSFRFQPRYYIC